jgi:two-component system sensor histidine kinase ChiS
MFGFRSKKPRVLIVDDDPIILNTLRDRLEFNGMAVITATNGVKGLAAAIVNKPDIIITDIAMPVLDGVEMIKAFRNTEIDKHIPIIVITGKEKIEDILAAMELHAEGYLSKPFAMSDLLGKIKNLLEASTDSALSR